MPNRHRRRPATRPASSTEPSPSDVEPAGADGVQDVEDLILVVSELLERASHQDPEGRVPPVAVQLANTLLRAFALRARLQGSKRPESEIWDLVEQVNRVGSSTWPDRFVPVRRE